MTGAVVLHGYRYSVYTRAARLALCTKGVDHAAAEIDPFADPPDPALARLHPFGRVPILVHGDTTIYETAAITRYVDAAFPGPPMVPADARAAARMAQVVAIVDAYAYRPLVRGVYSDAVFRPAMGMAADPDAVADGLAAAAPVLDALDAVAAEGLVLDGTALTLADCHLAPMIAAFVQAAKGADRLARRPALADWWTAIADWPALAATDPGLPQPPQPAP
ncbi:glutathione S-transferase family protein [Jannaschia sp. KMU-145]|uniref:glutathione S-transferase family protein n=1 Tax=Jannaschia halovivens TaxID=3388667 RepID=UPI00396B46BA